MVPKKILHVIRPAEGGMKGHLLALAGGLVRHGYAIEAACPPDTSVAEDLGRLGVPVHYIDLVGPLDPSRDFRCVSQLKEIMMRGKYDLVHFHGSKAGLVGRVAAILAGYDKTVVTVHNFIIYPEVPLAKKLLYKYGEKLLSRTTAKIITVSKALKNDLLINFGIPGDKIVPIYNGIETSEYSKTVDVDKARGLLGINPRQTVIGTVARMAPQKGLSYLIEAIPLILEKRDVVFVLAGDGPLQDELKKLAKDKGVQDKILFPGFINDIGSFLACLDVFVIPSISEGLSITTIEAMAAGLPVVAANVGGLPEVVVDGQTGLLIPPRDSAAISDAVDKILTNPQAAAEMGRQGSQRAREYFSTQTMIEQTCKVYQQVWGETIL